MAQFIQSSIVCIITASDIRPKDFLDLVERNRPYISFYLPKLSSQIKSVYSAENYLSKWISAEKKHHLVLFGLLHTLKNDLIGIIQLYNIDHELKECTLACFLDKKHQGNGFMAQSLKNIMPFCKESFGIKRLIARVKKDNTKSLLMLKRLSFAETKKSKTEHLDNKNDYRYFSLLF